MIGLVLGSCAVVGGACLLAGSGPAPPKAILQPQIEWDETRLAEAFHYMWEHGVRDRESLVVGVLSATYPDGRWLRRPSDKASARLYDAVRWAVDLAVTQQERVAA